MKKLLIASLVLCAASTVEARGRRYQAPQQQYIQPQQAQFSVPPQPITPTVSASVPPANTSAAGSAQWKAEISARSQSVAHIGGGFGGGSHEGNGMGATADQAIRNSCFWGQLTPIEIGVAKSNNGWYYATIFYR